MRNAVGSQTFHTSPVTESLPTQCRCVGLIGPLVQCWEQLPSSGPGAVPIEAQSDEQSLGRDIAIGDGRSDFGDPCVGQRSEALSYQSVSDSAAFACGRHHDGVDVVHPIHNDYEGEGHNVRTVEHDMGARAHDRCEVIVDGVQCIIKGLTLIVNRAAVGIEHEFPHVWNQR
jgi:hypothetical protein